ncbi:MAG: transporter substrate-binding domain-containing protein [Tabrizicola sp.]|nr:transporter substrate-binding domain-containing protein [Tabrizicola sp.]
MIWIGSMNRAASWLTRPLSLVVVSVFVPVVSPGTLGMAAAQEACSSYIVQEGDTLGTISTAAYGTLDYQTIFNANADLLRNDPTALPPGTEIRIPCADGRLTATEEIQPIAEAVASEAASAEASSGEYRRKIKVLTGGDWFPFTDETLTGGGAMVRVATTALTRGSDAHSYTLGWIDDWESHLNILLPNGSFDLSVAWYIPDCSALDQASELTSYTCLNFLFSDPLYDSVFGFFAQKDNPFANAKTFEDLKGARICRPESYSLHDLEAVGLVEPAITLSVPEWAEDCFDGLIDGTYDVATIESQLSNITIRDMGYADQIVENLRLSSIQSAAVMVWKDNPRAREYLDVINLGLSEMRQSGEWNTIVSSSLQEAFGQSAE